MSTIATTIEKLSIAETTENLNIITTEQPVQTIDVGSIVVKETIGATKIEKTFTGISIPSNKEVVIGTIPGGSRIEKVTAIVNTPFISGLTMTVGDSLSQDKLLLSTDTDCLKANIYSVEHYDTTYTADTVVKAYFNKASAFGNITIVVSYA